MTDNRAMKSKIALLGVVLISLWLRVPFARAITLEYWPRDPITVPEGDAQDTLGWLAGRSWSLLQMPERPLIGIRTHAVTNERNPTRALRTMLAGTGIEFSQIQPRVFRIEVRRDAVFDTSSRVVAKAHACKDRDPDFDCSITVRSGRLGPMVWHFHKICRFGTMFYSPEVEGVITNAVDNAPGCWAGLMQSLAGTGVRVYLIGRSSMVIQREMEAERPRKSIPLMRQERGCTCALNVGGELRGPWCREDDGQLILGHQVSPNVCQR